MNAAPLYDEGRLLRGLKTGSEDAWNQIYHKHKRVLFAKAFAILDDAMEAKDVVQELFISLWLKRSSLEISDSLEDYLYKAIRNRSLNRLESRKVYKKHTSQFSYLNNDASITLTYDETEARYERLSSAVQKISCDPAFPAFRLRHLEHKSFQQIADELGMAHASVKNQISRAMKKIRNMLK